MIPLGLPLHRFKQLSINRTILLTSPGVSTNPFFEFLNPDIIKVTMKGFDDTASKGNTGRIF